MVRTLPSHTPHRLDTSRILATSFALAVHVAALMVLLVPLGQSPLPETRSPVTPERWKVSEPIPTTPAPPQAVAATRSQAQTPVKPTVQTPRPLTESPVVVDNASVALTESVAEVATPDLVPAGDPAPLPAAQLRYAAAPAPTYPSDALRAGEQGTVMLKVLVDTNGTPLQVLVERSSGSRSLDRQAVRHVQQRWKFEPAMHQGQVVQAWGLVPIVFSLQ